MLCHLLLYMRPDDSTYIRMQWMKKVFMHESNDDDDGNDNVMSFDMSPVHSTWQSFLSSQPSFLYCTTALRVAFPLKLWYYNMSCCMMCPVVQFDSAHTTNLASLRGKNMFVHFSNQKSF